MARLTSVWLLFLVLTSEIHTLRAARSFERLERRAVFSQEHKGDFVQPERRGRFKAFVGNLGEKSLELASLMKEAALSTAQDFFPNATLMRETAQELVSEARGNAVNFAKETYQSAFWDTPDSILRSIGDALTVQYLKHRGTPMQRSKFDAAVAVRMVRDNPKTTAVAVGAVGVLLYGWYLSRRRAKAQRASLEAEVRKLQAQVQFLEQQDSGARALMEEHLEATHDMDNELLLAAQDRLLDACQENRCVMYRDDDTPLEFADLEELRGDTRSHKLSATCGEKHIESLSWNDFGKLINDLHVLEVLDLMIVLNRTESGGETQTPFAHAQSQYTVHRQPRRA